VEVRPEERGLRRRDEPPPAGRAAPLVPVEAEAARREDALDGGLLRERGEQVRAESARLQKP